MTDFGAWLGKNKALWTRVYDEVIAPDLEQEWKKRKEDHEREMQTKNEELQILATHSNNELIKKARLVEENERLKRLLQRHSISVPPFSQQLSIDTSDTTIPVNEYRHITDKYSELTNRYHEAAQKLKYLERKNIVVMQKNKEMKESVKVWQEYCDRHLGKQKTKTEAKANDERPKALDAIEPYETTPHSSSSPRPSAVKASGSFVGLERSSPALLPLPQPILDLTVKERDVAAREYAETNTDMERIERFDDFDHVPTLPETEPHGIMGSRSKNDISISHDQSEPDKTDSSQTTMDEVAEQSGKRNVALNVTEDDDKPQYVSERSLKRKRVLPTRVKNPLNQHSPDGTQSKPFRIKEEQFSSPPPPATPMHSLLREETMDLDELGSNIILTPRRRLRRTHSIHDNISGTLRNQRSNSAPVSGPLPNPEPSAGNVQVGSLDDSAPQTTETIDERAYSEPGDSIRVPSDVLQPLDPNVVAGVGGSASNKRIKREAREHDKYGFLLESGETPPPQSMYENKGRLPPDLARAQHNQRVRATKDMQTPVRNAHQTPKSAPVRALAAQSATPMSSANNSSNTPSIRQGRREAPATEPRLGPYNGPNNRPLWTMGPPAEPSRKAPTPLSLSKLQVSIRSKPVSEIRLQDFKANPKYNQGYSYAFSETVRKRSDRLCLPGCTNPSCCGSTFRALAAAAAPLPASQEEKLLQDFLGDAYDSSGLPQMNHDEKEELVLQARTRKMAKEHGKHRQAYDGRRSPPGYWRVDFPSTQEEEEDRAKAREMERSMVMERYLEAMRKGGKWIFRDE